MNTVSDTITIPVPVPYCLRLRHRSFNVTERSSRKSHQRTQHSSGCCQLTSLVMQETEEDSETKNQTMEYQPGDTQISIYLYIYVPSRDALYLGRCSRTLWQVLQHENRKKRKQVRNDITLTALSYLPNQRGEMSATQLATLCGTIWKANKSRINKHELWSR